MALLESQEKKVCNPSLTAPHVEHYYQCTVENACQSDAAIFPSRSMESLQMATQQLRAQIGNLRPEDDDSSLKRNGLSSPCDDYVILAGDGLISICMDRYSVQEERHEIITYIHAEENAIPLGCLSVQGYYTNFGIIGRFGCCPRPPAVLCQLTPNGEFGVLFGPLEFSRSRVTFSKNEVPSISVYQISPATQLLKINCKNAPFVKCDPTGISLSPPSIKLQEYRFALVTEKMEVRLWVADTKSRLSENSVLQLESVSPCAFNRIHSSSNPRENCIRFSPNGMLLSLMCSMDSENKCACLILDAWSLEVLCWIAAEAIHTWLRWIFPMFSTCATEVVLASYSHGDNKYDLNKFQMFYHKIPSTLQSLKYLCRIAIVKRVPHSSLHQLPLPGGLISFLIDGTPKERSNRSCANNEKNVVRKCSLM